MLKHGHKSTKSYAAITAESHLRYCHKVRG